MNQYIGKMLDNRYEILDVIGVGGMAVVYKAYCHRLHRFVAIKVLKRDLAADAEFRRRFHEEAQAVAMLSHPNIVSVYDVSKGDDLDYIVMELIDGITLKQYMQKKEGRLNWRESLYFITQIVRALGHAHSRGIIHRDIKPQNIMVLRDGSVKVADFGIARIMSAAQNTLTQEALGSVHYISPEQARGSHIDARADIYSAGVVLYEMLTGRLPFDGDSPVSVAIQHISAKPMSPRELIPDIPLGLEEITMKAMEKNPVDRFQSAGEMLDDLDEFRRDPNLVFRYDLQTNNARYDASRSMEAYDTGRQAPSYNDDYEYEEELVRSRRSAKGAMVVKGILVAAIIVGIAVAAIYFLNYWNNRPDEGSDLIEMPNLVGQLYEDVAANEQYADFNFIVNEGNDPDKQPGEIMNQNPDPGIMVKQAAGTFSNYSRDTPWWDWSPRRNHSSFSLKKTPI